MISPVWSLQGFEIVGINLINLPNLKAPADPVKQKTKQR